MKNLSFALEALQTLKSQVTLDIFGPIDDQVYWEYCQKRSRSMPSNIVVRYGGAIPRESVPTMTLDYDFFILPTQGENFGYVILEAMAAGCPVIVSDRTPWNGLVKHSGGWALPLEHIHAWRRVLQECADIDPKAYATLSLRARESVESWATITNCSDDTIQLFYVALAGNGTRTRGVLRSSAGR